MLQARSHSKLSTITALVVGAALWLPATTASAEQKYGFVDVQRVLREVDEGKEAMGALQAEFSRKQTKLDEQKQELEALKSSLEAQADLMKPELQQAKMRELQQKFVEWQRTGMELQRELDSNQAQMTSQILERMEKIIADIGREQSYTMILVKEMVLFAPSYFDLTNEVIRKYNTRFPAKKSKKGKKNKRKKK